MEQTSKMICQKCGADMNHHAVKIDYGMDDAALIDKDFGGILKEVHTVLSAAQRNCELSRPEVFIFQLNMYRVRTEYS